MDLRAQSGRGGEPVASVARMVDPCCKEGWAPGEPISPTPDLRAVSGNGANGARPSCHHGRVGTLRGGAVTEGILQPGVPRGHRRRRLA